MPFINTWCGERFCWRPSWSINNGRGVNEGATR
jgi:hypothetical protein